MENWDIFVLFAPFSLTHCGHLQYMCLHGSDVSANQNPVYLLSCLPQETSCLWGCFELEQPHLIDTVHI